MNLSYWEIKSWLSNIDYTIVGSGIVGLNCALRLKEKFPKSKILILEKGSLPQGASTKNAGFSCFGSMSEIIDDLKSHSESEIISLIKKRKEGLKYLRNFIGDNSLNYKQNGGFEIFTKKDVDLFENCQLKLNEVNKLLKPLFSSTVFEIKDNTFGFKKIVDKLIFNPFEGQIDTGLMMEALLEKVKRKNIKILNNINVTSFLENNSSVEIVTENFSYKSSKLFIAANGFSNKLLNEKIAPARAQVLITKPIKNLQIEGTFHLDRGYYYFRNIDNRILLGGGRNLDFKKEETDKFGLNYTIQSKLELILKNIILPKNEFEIDYRWSGIMGVGNKKTAIVKSISNNVFCGIRLGGMGIAIGSSIGNELANKI
jgi:glycine/D-amino acid oxidase-like deaminating enzyme